MILPKVMGKFQGQMGFNYHDAVRKLSPPATSPDGCLAGANKPVITNVS